MAKLLFGTPARGRAWALPQWFSHIAAAVPEGYDYQTLLLLPENDTESIRIAEDHGAVIIIGDHEELEYERLWTQSGIFEKMALLRNSVLREVRRRHPDFYVSVDSDIFIHPESIKSMLHTYEQHNCSAVGGLAHLSAFSDKTVNCGYFTDRSLVRYRRGTNKGIFPVDILMAYKLMDPDAYAIDYGPHIYGEDLGWSANVKREGLKLHFDAMHTSKHVMYPERVNEIDKRCGY